MAGKRRYEQRKHRNGGGASLRLNGVQWAAVGLVVVVVAVGAWWVLSSRSKAATAQSTPAAVGAARQWSSAPAMTIDTSKKYYANIKMAAGQIIIQLFPDKAPITVNSFVFLANQGFYNGTTFHRVIDGFMAQGGDGCISVTANVAPRACADMHEAWQKGDSATAMKINARLAPLHDALFVETSPAPIKYACSLLGKSSPDVRLPLVAASPQAQETVRAAMRSAGVLN